MILLDTSILSLAFRRRRPGPQEKRLARMLAELTAGKTPLALPGVVLQEVLSGIRSEKQFADLERRLLAAFDVLSPTTEEFVDAARLKNACLAKGVSATGPDCLIATQTIARGAVLFATDPDFQLIAKHSPLKLLQLD